MMIITSMLSLVYAAVLSVVTQRSSPGALRDDTKNGCVGDYVVIRIYAFQYLEWGSGEDLLWLPGRPFPWYTKIASNWLERVSFECRK